MPQGFWSLNWDKLLLPSSFTQNIHRMEHKVDLSVSSFTLHISDTWVCIWSSEPTRSFPKSETSKSTKSTAIRSGLWTDLFSPVVFKGTASRCQVLAKSRFHPRAPEPWMSKPPSWPPVTPGPLVPGVGAPSSDGAWGHAGPGPHNKWPRPWHWHMASRPRGPHSGSRTHRQWNGRALSGGLFPFHIGWGESYPPSMCMEIWLIYKTM